MKLTRKRLYGKLDITKTGISLYMEDEIFVKVVGWRNYWISNYSRLIKYDEKKGYKLIEPNDPIDPYYYTCLKTENRLNPKENLKQYYHRLTAKAFCVNDNPEVKTDVHHIHTFDANKSCIENNRADNLMWVAAKVHAMLDSIDYILITDEFNNTKKFNNPLDAFRKLNINEDIFYYQLICKYEPIIDNVELKYVKYAFALVPSEKVNLITIYTKNFEGKKKNFLFGKIEQNGKEDIKKYGEERINLICDNYSATSNN